MMSLKARNLTTYDFSSERKSIVILGCFNILKKPFPHFLLNILYILFALSVYGLLAIMGVVTLFILQDEKPIRIQVIKILFSLTSVVLLVLLAALTKTDMDKAVEFLRIGIFEYSNDGTKKGMFAIKEKRNKQIRCFIPLLTWFCYLNAVLNVFVYPIFKYFFGNVDNKLSVLNPYLSLPLWLPFPTNKLSGFAFAFILNGVFWFLLTFVYVITVEVTLSCGLQLSAEIEVLNYSLQNIQQRSLYKLSMRRNASNCERGDNHLQKLQTECLRENIIHHHTILRFQEVVSTYIGGVFSIGILLYSIIMGTSIFIIIEDPHININVILSLVSDSLGFLQLCLMGQIIINKSTETTDALYSTPWVECSKEFKVLFCIMLTNAQKAMSFHAIGFDVIASIETFSNMVSVGYKTVNLLR